MVNYYLFRALGFTPTILADSLRRMTEAKWDIRPDPDRFTPREVIAHMADWEPIMRARIQSGVDQPGSTVYGLDEGVIAIERDYAHQDVESNIAKFIAERAITIEYLKGLSDDQWASHFIHSEIGRVTAYDYANTMVCHDVYHVEQLLHV